MVILAQAGAAGVLLFAQQAADPVLERLDPPRRAAVVMALLAMVLLGLLLVACIMIGGRWVRRMARHQPGSQLSSTTIVSGLNSRGLSQSLRSVLPETSTGDTVQGERSSQETRADSY